MSTQSRRSLSGDGFAEQKNLDRVLQKQKNARTLSKREVAMYDMICCFFGDTLSELRFV